MTTIQQLPQKIDSNVTVNVPKKIDIDWQNGQGWYITIDGKFVNNPVITPGNVPTRMHFDDVAQALDWLCERHLIVTKAYKELDKTVKKVAKSKAKSATK